MDLFARILEQAGPLGKYAEVADGYYMFPKLEGDLGNGIHRERGSQFGNGLLNGCPLEPSKITNGEFIHNT